MATNYLKKMGIREIIAKAQTDEHGEILKMVGATDVIFPDQEAAKRLTPMLASSVLFNFMPISKNLSLAEVRVNADCVGKTLLEANLRRSYGRITSYNVCYTKLLRKFFDMGMKLNNTEEASIGVRRFAAS